MPLQESKMSTNIRLKFRTMQENALIFVAAGRTDYCLIRMENGRINLNYKIDTTLVQVKCFTVKRRQTLIPRLFADFFTKATEIQ